MKRYQFFITGRIGRPSERKRSFAMLPTVPDLPGVGWRQLGQAAWRSGVGSAKGPVSHRARRSGAFTAVRRFRQEDPPRGLFVQVLPLATVDDAREQALNARSSLWTGYPGVVRLEEREVESVRVPEMQDVLTWEHFNERGDVRGYQRTISGRIENIAVLVSGSAVGDGQFQ